jgi:formate dehydrogenase subunit beta
MSGSVQELRTTAARLLDSGSVQVVIGYGPGTLGRRRALFARTAAAAAALVHDDECRQNLAVYLLKPEVRQLGRAALVATPAALRSLVQLASERQIGEAEVLALVVREDGSVRELTDLAAVQAQLASVPDRLHPAAQSDLERLSAMTAAERRAFWTAQLGRCLRCYACRASCPMCYCERCTMDCNRPQWVPVASHGLGNLEYHLVRAMHLAGRCVECGNCGRACPVGIPVQLLTLFAEESVRRHFGVDSGAAHAGYALSTYRPQDQESFIR